MSPIDLIPDVIPVLGLADDVPFVPLGILLAVRCVPPELMAAASRVRPRSRLAASFIVIVWVTTAVAATVWLRAGWPG